MRTIVPANAFGRRAALAGMAFALLGSACRPKKCAVTSSEALRPEDPVDDSFLGCQLSASCGAHAAPEGVTLVLQPGAKPGDYTRCPVSGAVFQVTEQRQRREYGGHTLFFCCGACARYFDKNAAAVAGLRRI